MSTLDKKNSPDVKLELFFYFLFFCSLESELILFVYSFKCFNYVINLVE